MNDSLYFESDDQSLSQNTLIADRQTFVNNYIKCMNPDSIIDLKVKKKNASQIFSVIENFRIRYLTIDFKSQIIAYRKKIGSGFSSIHGFLDLRAVSTKITKIDFDDLGCYGISVTLKYKNITVFAECKEDYCKLLKSFQIILGKVRIKLSSSIFRAALRLFMDPYVEKVLCDLKRKLNVVDESPNEKDCRESSKIVTSAGALQTQISEKKEELAQDDAMQSNKNETKNLYNCEKAVPRQFSTRSQLLQCLNSRQEHLTSSSSFISVSNDIHLYNREEPHIKPFSKRRAINTSMVYKDLEKELIKSNSCARSTKSTLKTDIQSKNMKSKFIHSIQESNDSFIIKLKCLDLKSKDSSEKPLLSSSETKSKIDFLKSVLTVQIEPEGLLKHHNQQKIENLFHK